MRARPSVGSVIRHRTFSSVDLPAPFRPMTPSVSPRLTSKDMSLSAQNSSYFERSPAPDKWSTSFEARDLSHRPGADSFSAIASRRAAYLCRWPWREILYFLPRVSARITISDIKFGVNVRDHLDVIPDSNFPSK